MSCSRSERVVLDHSVVDERELAALVEVRMRVVIGDAAMGGPAGMGDAKVPVRRRFVGAVRRD